MNLPNHAEFSKMIRTKTLTELRIIYSSVCSIHGPDSGVAALVDKHIKRKTTLGRASLV